MAALRPMLAELVEAPFDRPGWIFEIKWDGYRALADVGPRGAKLVSRHGLPLNAQFSAVAKALGRMHRRAVLDGEIVVLDRAGIPSFHLLQQYLKDGRGALRYMVFDLLSLDGRDLRRRPLLERKALLKRVLPQNAVIRYADHVEKRGKAFFSVALRRGLEGIMAKDGASPYRGGQRSAEWLKIKTHRRQEAVIVGYTEPRGGRSHFGALILGVYERGRLVSIGHSGTGFDEPQRADLLRRLRRLRRATSPFRTPPKTNAPVHWVRPELVCEVSFAEWTADGILRIPVFVGLRADKRARDVRRERALPRL